MCQCDLYDNRFQDQIIVDPKLAFSSLSRIFILFCNLGLNFSFKVYLKYFTYIPLYGHMAKAFLVLGRLRIYLDLKIEQVYGGFIEVTQKLDIMPVGFLVYNLQIFNYMCKFDII